MPAADAKLVTLAEARTLFAPFADQPTILIAGSGIKSGVHTNPVSPADIAPTLCALLGIEMPSGCDGVILPSVFR